MELILGIFYLGVTLVFGALVAKLAEKFDIPDIPLLLLVGVLIGPILHIMPTKSAMDIFDIVGPIGLIFILLGGAFTMRMSILKNVMGPVIRLDTIALVITLLITGLAFNLIAGLDIYNPAGYLIGAILCATDPATLIPVFSKVKINPEIAITLEAESIFNDPLGIVATTLVLATLGLGKSVNPIIDLISLAGGAIIVGYIAAKIFKWVITRAKFYEYVAPLVLGGAMILLYLGEYLFPKIIGYGFSGYMAIAIMALILGDDLSKIAEEKEDYECIVKFSDVLALLSRIFIFVFLGACVQLDVLFKYFVPGLIVALVSILIARPIGVFIALIKTKFNFGEKLYIALEGPRGVVPAALTVTAAILILKHIDVISRFVPNPTEYSHLILVSGFLTILVSVILEASWAGILAEKLLKK
ncbi:cation:proton antiporter [Methanocaldococcus indicus]|uniref:cation:proton antiporter n=1 Tax=Methanocaldococcus indicus TaxID=213231 RepID=UPI003C6D64D9